MSQPIINNIVALSNIQIAFENTETLEHHEIGYDLNLHMIINEAFKVCNVPNSIDEINGIKVSNIDLIVISVISISLFTWCIFNDRNDLIDIIDQLSNDVKRQYQHRMEYEQSVLEECSWWVMANKHELTSYEQAKRYFIN